MANNSFYQNSDVLDVAMGSFSGMAGADIKNKVKVSRQDKTFAVKAIFPYLSLTRFVSRGQPFQQVVSELKSLERELNKPIEVILPSPQASQLSGLSRVSALGGAEHELGHILIDMGGSYLPSESELRAKGFDKLLTKFQSHPKHDILKENLHRWTNVLADVRLERFMGVLYEPTRSRFHAIQTWVHDLEKDGRESGQMGLGGSVMCIIRDLGKGWNNPMQQTVLKDYQKLYPQSWELATQTKPIWSKVLPTDTCTEQDIKASVHLPLFCALELVMALADIMEKQPKKKGDGKDSKEGALSYGGKGRISDVHELNDGQALDPSSAMTKAVEQAESKLDHKVFYDSKMSERKVKL